MMNLNEFLADTRLACFLCFKFNSSVKKCSEREHQSFINLCRYLNIDGGYLKNILNSSKPQQNKLTVILCEDCCAALRRFDQFYQQFELVRLHLNGCVQQIHNVMMGGESLSTVDVPNLQKKIMEKCAVKTESSLPKVKLKPLSIKSKNQVIPVEAIMSAEEDRTQSTQVLRFYRGDENNEDDGNAQGLLEVGNETMETSNQPINGTTFGRRPVAVGYNRANAHRKCHVCGKIVRHLKVHMRTHTGEKPCVCPHCPQQFRNHSILKQHKLKHHRPVIFQDCRDSSVSDDTFHSGIAQLFEKLKQDLSPTEDGFYPCAFCSRTGFAYRRDAEAHVIKIHLDHLKSQLKDILREKSINQTKEEMDPRHVKCHVCGKICKKYRLHLHLKMHTEGKTVTCPFCPEKFTRDEFLRLHTNFKHRPVIFAECRDLTVTDEEFDACIAQLFKNLREESSGRNRNHPCNFCGKCCVQWRYTEDHMMRSHFDLLTLRLREILRDFVDEREKAGVNINPLEILDDLIKTEAEELMDPLADVSSSNCHDPNGQGFIKLEPVEES